MTTLTQRNEVTTLVAQAMTSGARQDRACAAIGMSERTLQRWQRDIRRGDQRPLRVFTPANKLSPQEQQHVLAVVNCEEFGSMSPSQIVPRLCDRGQYIASESAMYRLLKSHQQLKHRGAQRPVQTRQKPRTVSATAPNQVFSWDITYLPTRVRGYYFYLYLFLDVFSRKIVGWQVYDTECSDLAAQVMRDICQREKIKPGQLVLHSDNGSPMKGASMLATLQSLGVMASFSRPAVSNDNPYSESLFKTLKYRPSYPHQAFESLNDARLWVDTFVHWYNHNHHHSAISFVTPAQRHDGADIRILQQRKAVYEHAKARHPQRWNGRATRCWEYVNEVHLNPGKHKTPDGSQAKAA